MTTPTTFEDARTRAARLADGLEDIASVIGDQLDMTDEARQLRDKARHIRDDRFRVVVVGEFKRGKSTLLNAMLGGDVLPRKVTECTAVITMIRYASAPTVRVEFDTDRPADDMSLEEFRKHYELSVDDAAAPAAAAERFLHVKHAVISYPIELCRQGVELVDSPGLGAHEARSKRTQKFLPQADAVVFVLNAKQFLSLEEVHFLEAVLLPLGLRNVFFVINGWNLIDESVIRPEDADVERANLEALIRQRLTPFCVVAGKDRSADRIFRVNALGALKARIRKPIAAAMLEESAVPEFEKSLEKFLVDDRAKARADVVLGVVRAVADEAARFVNTQLAMADKSVAEIEAERIAIEPKLQRLRGIRDHIVNFLQSQSAVLQDVLVTSLHEHINRIEKDLPDEVAKFDISPITSKFLVWEGIKDKMPWRSEEDRFQAQVARCLKPQVQRMLERRFADWQQALVRNEMRAVMIDVEKHLQEEAAEYQRVMRELEDKIGAHGSPLQIEEQVKRWLGSEQATGPGTFQLPAMNTLGEVIGLVIMGIVAEVLAELVLHVATGGITLVVSGITAVLRMGWREASLRNQLQQAIVTGIKDGLKDMWMKYAADIRTHVKAGFEGLEGKIAGSIAEEIALIDASLQAIIDKKKEREYSADQERARLEAARTAIADRVARLTAVAAG
ncbi:dynamin family protein [Fimbriiglobus ruber]|uniref:Dynamin-type G domain-containing protein n=1 Tax=Fimbriiglobus ruber TaxID=1908690 RepID=A0A225D853_9BACT|nr:dynamin family protein [Fimbriiglobus ruber]OWK34728.1 hypothetical protein FRUB_09570 [Fimbriiglobus ruber]